MIRTAALSCLAMALAACSSAPRTVLAPIGVRPASTPATAPNPPVTPRVQHRRGVSSLIGASEDELLAALGTPRLDWLEGEARKLQFAAAGCVLDIYLYPTSEGQSRRAAYAEARAITDGSALPEAECVAAIERGLR